MECLEFFICKYYNYSHTILGIISVMLLEGTVIASRFFKENIRYVINRVLHNVFFAIAIVSVAELFYILSLTPEIKYVHFNVMIFALVVLMVVVYGIFQGMIFKKVKLPVLQVCKNIGYMVWFEIFLLTITNHLELIEWLTGILVLIDVELLHIIIKKIEKKKDDEEIVSKESGYPNPDLFYTRKRQLEKFIPVLEQQKKEPYAIMISGEWGVGKSSFVKALEKRLEDDSFIWIYAGSEKSVSEIMLEISEQILKILKENNIFVEKGGLIEKYFLTFSGLLEETGIKFFNQIANTLGVGKEEDSKEYLNSKLKDLNKTIYLIVDDLDRCSKEYQEKMFKVIRESTELAHCKTIFLVDKAQFLDCNDNYIEKYISYTLELCEVQGKEILNYFINDIVKDEFIRGMNTVLLKERSVESVKQIICNFPDDILNTCGIEISKASKNIKNKKPEDAERKKEEAKITDINGTILEIRKNINNARKVKNYLKGIRRDIVNLNVGIEECSVEFQREDWLKAIIEVQFLKHFLPKLYDDIKMSNDISEFGRRYKGYSVEIILGMKYGFLILQEKKEKILNHIIYNVDVIDFLQVKSEREKYLSELYNNAMIDNIMKYLEYAQTYDDLKKILEVCANQKFDDYESRENFIRTILSIMAKQSSMDKVDNVKFWDLSKQIIDCIKQWKLSEKEKNICIYEGRMIIRRVIVDNTHFLRNILLMLFGVTVVESNWQTLSVTDVDEFYSILKRIDSNSIYKGLENETDKLSSIKTYYTNLGEELQKEKYSDIDIDFAYIFNEIELIFEICMFWNDIETALKSDNEEEGLFEQYFVLEGGYGCYVKETTFIDVDNMQQALEVLIEFYESKKSAYKSNYSLLLLRLAHQMVLMYEKDNSWYKDKKEEIDNLLVSAAEKCYMYDKLEDDYANKAIDELKVFVYRFCTSVK